MSTLRERIEELRDAMGDYEGRYPQPSTLKSWLCIIDEALDAPADEPGEPSVPLRVVERIIKNAFQTTLRLAACRADMTLGDVKVNTAKFYRITLNNFLAPYRPAPAPQADYITIERADGPYRISKKNLTPENATEPYVPCESCNGCDKPDSVCEPLTDEEWAWAKTNAPMGPFQTERPADAPVTTAQRAAWFLTKCPELLDAADLASVLKGEHDPEVRAWLAAGRGGK